MKLLIDMNLSPQWAIFLQGHGFEAQHWSALGASRAPEDEIMAYASNHDFIVMTHDLDFGAILATTHGNKPSVIQFRARDISPAAIGLRIIAALRQVASELDQGALLTIDTDRNRLRMLPLARDR